MAQSRATALARPGAAPVEVEVGIIAKPERLADRRVQGTESSTGQQLAGTFSPTAVTMLHHGVHRGTAALLCGGHLVELGQCHEGRLLDQHRHTCLERLESQPMVGTGWGRHRDQVDLLVGQQLRQGWVRGSEPPPLGEGLGPLDPQIGAGHARSLRGGIPTPVRSRNGSTSGATTLDQAELRRRLFREIVPGPEYEALCTHPTIKDWFEWFLGGPVHLHRRKIIRHTLPDEHANPRTAGIGAATRHLRLSTDIRYQLASDAIDERWQQHWHDRDGL